MATPPNDDTKMLFRLLSDRQWHSYTVVRDAIAKTVPPGRALRKYEESVGFLRRYRDDPEYDTRADDDKRILLGQRKCAQVAISNWRRGGGVEVRGENELKEIRVRPGFTSTAIAGFEPVAGEQDPPSEGVGPTEVPPDVSEPPEASSEGGNEVSVPVMSAAPVVKVVKDPQNPGHWLPVDPAPASEPAQEGSEPASYPAKWRPLSAHAESAYEWPALAPQSPAPAPECDLCGLAVSDQARHDSWHAALNGDFGSRNDSVLTASQVRDVVVDVVRLELDQFQRGMQGWLLQQFMQLAAVVAGPGGGVERWTGMDSSRSQKEQT